MGFFAGRPLNPLPAEQGLGKRQRCCGCLGIGMLPGIHPPAQHHHPAAHRESTRTQKHPKRGAGDAAWPGMLQHPASGYPILARHSRSGAGGRQGGMGRGASGWLLPCASRSRGGDRLGQATATPAASSPGVSRTCSLAGGCWEETLPFPIAACVSAASLVIFLHHLLLDRLDPCSHKSRGEGVARCCRAIPPIPWSHCKRDHSQDHALGTCQGCSQLCPTPAGLFFWVLAPPGCPASPGGPGRHANGGAACTLLAGGAGILAGCGNG